jgi:hypothetical protein
VRRGGAVHVHLLVTRRHSSRRALPVRDQVGPAAPNRSGFPRLAVAIAARIR